MTKSDETIIERKHNFNEHPLELEWPLAKLKGVLKFGSGNIEQPGIRPVHSILYGHCSSKYLF